MIARFAVGAPGERGSGTWRLWRHTNRAKSDVFLAPRSIAGALKLSFHESGEIRDAFTREFQIQYATATAQHRTRLTWQRSSYEESGVVRLYQLCFPHSELRQLTSGERAGSEPIIWIPPMAGSNATFIEFVLTRPGLKELKLNNFIPLTEGPLAHWFLPSGENFLALPHAGHLDNPRLEAIAAAARAIRPPETSMPSATTSLRLILVTAPVDGIGATIETAWPCTVQPAPSISPPAA